MGKHLAGPERSLWGLAAVFANGVAAIAGWATVPFMTRLFVEEWKVVLPASTACALSGAWLAIPAVGVLLAGLPALVPLGRRVTMGAIAASHLAATGTMCFLFAAYVLPFTGITYCFD